MKNKLLLKKIKIALYTFAFALLFFVILEREECKKGCVEALTCKCYDYGFVLKNIHLNGIHYYNKKDITSLLTAYQGKPLISIDKNEILEQIRNITWIDNVSLYIKYPDTLHIKVTEKIPAAYWQHSNKINLIDAQGNIIKTEIFFFGKPLVIGAGANENILPLLRALAKYKDLMIKYATFIGKRRWDITLENDLILKLPDHNIEFAVSKYIDFVSKTPIDCDNVISVDLRYVRNNKIHLQSKKNIRKKNEI